MKKKVALSIAGATAALLGGWKLVQQLVDREDESFAASDSGFPTGPSTSAGPSSPSWTENPAAPATRATDSGPGPSNAPKPAAKAAATGLDEKSSKAELYEIATELKIPGRSKMSKAALLDAIRGAS